jgi:CBS domain containing-hemolysin-like protein
MAVLPAVFALPGSFALPAGVALLAEADVEQGSHLTLLVYVAVALSVSFLCSIWEAVLLATPLSHIELMVQGGSKAGKHLQQMRRNVEQPISAILTLNTIAHTVGAAGAGAEATRIFGSQWFGVISAVLTLLILVFSEVIPKTLGTVYCRRLSGFTGTSVHALVRIFYPFVRVFDLMTRAMRPKHRRPTVTRAELAVMARISADEGGLQKGEQRTFENLLKLSEIKISEVMTPRTVIFMLPETSTVGELLSRGDLPPFSRIPISPGSADDIRAYVLMQDILERGVNDEDDITLHELGRPLEIRPGTASVASVLDFFIDQHAHILLVVDEYGGTAGLVTLEDALETLLGREIVDESDRVADLQDLARQRKGLQWEWFARMRENTGREPRQDLPEAPPEVSEPSEQ